MATKKIEEIKTHATFESLFTINDELLAKIEQDMRDDRYDITQPIILATWQGQNEPVCIDGHTRLKAAKNSGIEEVPVWLHEFDTEEEALEKAIRLQRNRRNMTDAEITACIETLDKTRPRGGDRRSAEAKSKASSDAIEKPSAKSAKETADLLGISTTKVERTRALLKNGDPETIEAVKNGEMSSHKAYQETKKNRSKTDAGKSKKNSKEQVADEGQKPEQVDKAKESTNIAPVFLSLEHFGALRELGGSIEEHVAKAIELYLKSLQNQCGKTSTEDAPEDDEEEYFDPADYIGEE
jgi:ParB-like chromosome segregation protein Spo0J